MAPTSESKGLDGNRRQLFPGSCGGASIPPLENGTGFVCEPHEADVRGRDTEPKEPGTQAPDTLNKV